MNDFGEEWFAQMSNNEPNKEGATASGAAAESEPESESKSKEASASESEAEVKAEVETEVAAMIAGRKSMLKPPHLFITVLTPAEMPMPKRRQKQASQSS